MVTLSLYMPWGRVLGSRCIPPLLLNLGTRYRRVTLTYRDLKEEHAKFSVRIIVLIRHSNWLRSGRSGDRIPETARFPAPVQTGPGAHSASYTMCTGSFQGLNRLGLSVDHPPSSSAKVKEGVGLYSPSWSSWPVLGWPLHFIIVLLAVIWTRNA